MVRAAEREGRTARLLTLRLLAALAALAATTAPGSARPLASGEPRPSLAKLVGQRFVVRLDGHRPSRRFLARVRAGEVGGVIVFPDNSSLASLRTLLGRLNAAARAGGNPPMLVVADQEGGSVKRLPAGPPSRSPRELGRAGDPRRAFREGVATGRYLRRIGITVDLAPVLDVPVSSASFLGTRAYGTSRFIVARVGVAFARGLRAGGVAATAKHFPGLGTALRSTDDRPVTIQRSRAELDRRLLPFRVAIRDGVDLAMVANASYPAYDRSGRPAVFSTAIVERLLRRTLGFEGLVISDDLEAAALASHRSPATAAMRAGVDLVLFARSEAGGGRAYDDALADARRGRLSRAELERVYSEIVELKRGLYRVQPRSRPSSSYSRSFGPA
jgi:beta-N-acetylhexosaminidase